MSEVGCAASVSSQYETLFRQNDIDAEVLSELTDGDLEKFGVSFGHRKRLLKAIASLRFDGNCSETGKPRAASNTSGSRRAASAHGHVL